MVGRTRKAGRREANGRIQRAYHNPRAQVAEQPHRKSVPSQFREFPEAETGFGRLMLNNCITPAQYEAGKRFAELVEDYRRSINAPSSNPCAMAFEPSIAGQSAGMPDQIARRIKSQYDDAFVAIDDNRQQRAVAHHAVYDRAITDFEVLALLRSGLDKLIKHFGIDSRLHLRQKCSVQ